MTIGPALSRPLLEGSRSGAPVVRAVVVHDDAMLARITSSVGLQPIGSFRYDVDPATGRAVVQLEVAGTQGHVARVQQLLRRLIGVLDVCELSTASDRGGL